MLKFKIAVGICVGSKIFLRNCNFGKFYARLLLGESPYDVAIRIHQFMGTIRRDYEKHGMIVVRSKKYYSLDFKFKEDFFV